MNKIILGIVIAVLALAAIGEGAYILNLKHGSEPAPESTVAYGRPASQLGAPHSKYVWNPGAASQPVTHVPFAQPAFAQADSWDPFQEMDQIQDTMNRMFRESFNRGMTTDPFLQSRHTLTYEPDIDVQDEGKEYVIKVDLPGIDKDKINIKVEGGQLMISGQRETEKEETPNQNYYRMERSFGSFMRAIPLPADADSSGMKVDSREGVLTIRLPKTTTNKQTAQNT